MADQQPVFTEPTEPDPKPIMLLHRGHDGFVTIHDKNEYGHFRDLYAIKASELSEGLFREQIAQDLGRDSYYSVNGFYRTRRTPSRANPRFMLPARSNDTLRWLTACYLDLDCYRLGISMGQAVGTLIDMQDAGIIPPASMLTRSGRGVWAMWFLRDALGGSGPQAAAWAPKQTYHRIQHRLGEITAALGHDASATDAARVTRVPGSINGKAGVRVHYWLQADQDGQPFLYTLDELCDRLNVQPVTRTTPTLDRVVNPPSPERSALGRSGWKALWARRLDGFLQLAAMRNGGFNEGTRYRACWIYAAFMQRARVDESEIIAHVNALADSCRPALPRSEARAAIKTRRKLDVKIRNQKIADWLWITPTESHAMGGIFPPASRYSDTIEPADLSPQTRAQRQEQRRGALASIIGTGNKPPTLRELQDSLDELGIEAALATIAKDLKAIGKTNPRARATDDSPTLIDL